MEASAAGAAAAVTTEVNGTIGAVAVRSMGLASFAAVSKR